jgi:two-component sensor histidine kinase
VRLLALIQNNSILSKINQINFGKYLKDLTSNLMRALLKGRDIALAIDADEAQLEVDCIPCGQIVTEL